MKEKRGEMKIEFISLFCVWVRFSYSRNDGAGSILIFSKIQNNALHSGNVSCGISCFGIGNIEFSGNAIPDIGRGRWLFAALEHLVFTLSTCLWFSIQISTSNTLNLPVLLDGFLLLVVVVFVKFVNVLPCLVQYLFFLGAFLFVPLCNHLFLIFAPLSMSLYWAWRDLLGLRCLLPHYIRLFFGQHGFMESLT